MLIVSEAVKTVFFLPDYFRSTLFRRLFWYLDNPTGDPDVAMASRHYAKRASYPVVSFDDVDLSDKGEYEKVALVVSPANALAMAWRQKAVIHAKRQPEIVERLESVGLSHKPAFREFIDKIDQYSEIIPDLDGATSPIFPTCGADSSFFDRVIRIDGGDELKEYLEERVDFALPSELPSIDIQLPEVITHDDLSKIRAVADNEYSFFGEKSEDLESKLVEISNLHLSNTDVIAEFVSHKMQTVFYIPDFPYLSSVRKILWWLEEPSVPLRTALKGRTSFRETRRSVEPLTLDNYSKVREYETVIILLDPAAAIHKVWAEIFPLHRRRRADTIEKLEGNGLISEPDFNNFVLNIDRYREVMMDVDEPLSNYFSDVEKYMANSGSCIRVDCEGEFVEFVNKKTGSDIAFETSDLFDIGPLFLSSEALEELENTTWNAYSILSEYYSFADSKISALPNLATQALAEIPVIYRREAGRTSGIEVVCMLKEDPDVVRTFVNYYTSVGVDKIHLFFDDPDDPSIKLVKDHPRVNAVPCDSNFWEDVRPGSVEARQCTCYTRAYKALEDGWLIVCDADELLTGDDCSLVDLLTGAPDGVRIVRFQSAEAVWSGEKSAISAFSADMVRYQAGRRDWGCISQYQSSLVEKSFRRGMLSHRSGKNAIRAGFDVSRVGIHRTFFSDKYDGMRPPGGYQSGIVVHFDAVSYTHWKQKIENRLTKDHGFSGLDVARIQQLELLKDADEQGFQDVFNMLYRPTETESKIRALSGTIRRIAVCDDLPDSFGATAGKNELSTS